jgi:GNAT superfamily N-acetyltransferase
MSPGHSTVPHGPRNGDAKRRRNAPNRLIYSPRPARSAQQLARTESIRSLAFQNIARGRGVGLALVDAALTWAHARGYQTISLDFETANPLSRPFWLNAGFRPAGYGVLRLIHGAPGRP